MNGPTHPEMRFGNAVTCYRYPAGRFAAPRLGRSLADLKRRQAGALQRSDDGGRSLSFISRQPSWPEFCLALRRSGFRPTRHLLTVHVATQRLRWYELMPASRQRVRAAYRWRATYVISTSAWGIGQVQNSNRTPVGLHRVARKIGGGYPIGTVFRSRQPVGCLWRGMPEGMIAHRIFWLEGLEPGFNRGGEVDSFARYIYLHGFNDETTLGRPRSHGCVHIAAADLMPLYDRLPIGTLVWIAER